MKLLTLTLAWLGAMAWTDAKLWQIPVFFIGAIVIYATAQTSKPKQPRLYSRYRAHGRQLRRFKAHKLRQWKHYTHLIKQSDFSM